MIEIFTDGSTRPTNPGPSGYGIAWYQDGKSFMEQSGFLGDDLTNNIAEYVALIVALKSLHEFQDMNVVIRSDSMLVVKQVSGLWRVKQPHLRGLYEEAIKLRTAHQKVGRYITLKHVKAHVGIAGNERADDLALKAVLNRTLCSKWILDLVSEVREAA
ncbi:hypothetical protein LCGC14_0263680 [marine sediment metagenome]|uniref:ribonuclease H n=1 Tax=marine sediment metagenome TaxID=412755 RepID=A0A0F9U5D7_9ZZZZ